MIQVHQANKFPSHTQSTAYKFNIVIFRGFGTDTK